MVNVKKRSPQNLHDEKFGVEIPPEQKSDVRARVVAVRVQLYADRTTFSHLTPSKPHLMPFESPEL